MIKKENLSHWADLYLDRVLSDADAKNLLDCFAKDPGAKDDFVEEVVFSAMIHGLSVNFEEEIDEVMETIRLGAAAPDVTALVMRDLRSQPSEAAVVDSELKVTPISRQWLGGRSIGVGIAACLAGLFLVFLFLQNREVHATFSRLDGAQWGGKSPEYLVGDQIGNERLELLSGFAVLNFGDGVRVSIEGPAYFFAQSPTQMNLDCGEVSAHVDTSGIGFRVVTEHGTVTDLGTSFEVSVERGKSTNVAVLDGVVAFRPVVAEEEHQILAGRGIHVKEDDSKVTLLEIDPKKRKNRRLEMLTGVREKGGDIRIVSARDINNPQSLKTYQSLAILPEKRNVKVKSPTLVNIWKPGNYKAEAENELAEQRDLGNSQVDSFLVQFNPPTVKRGKGVEPFQFRGGIEFDRPVVGIMTNAEEILASNAQCGLSRINYRDLVKGELEFRDRVFLSKDRRTLTFDWIVTPLYEQSRDQIRVLVESENNDTN